MSDRWAILRIMKIRLSKRRRPEQLDPEGDPHAPFVDVYQDYLEHARWVFEVHDRRGVGFQRATLAILGLDGVILSIVLGLQPATRRVVPSALTGLAAALVVASSVCAVRALVPREVSVASTGKLLDQRGEIFEPPDGRPARYPSAARAGLAASLLSRHIQTEQPVKTARQRERTGESAKAQEQPLFALEDFVSTRARRLKQAAWLLVAGLVLSVLSWSAASIPAQVIP